MVGQSALPTQNQMHAIHKAAIRIVFFQTGLAGAPAQSHAVQNIPGEQGCRRAPRASPRQRLVMASAGSLVHQNAGRSRIATLSHARSKLNVYLTWMWCSCRMAVDLCGIAGEVAPSGIVISS